MTAAIRPIDVQSEPPNRTVLAVVRDEDAARLSSGLNEAWFPHTRISTTGGFLLRTNAAILVVVAEARLDELLSVIVRYSERTTVLQTSGWGDELALLERPIEVEVGGATIFVTEIERFESFGERAGAESDGDPA